jgi:hypothetical protein
VSDLDADMEEVADFFAGRHRGERDVMQANALDRSALDFSLASLHVVDRWLGHLRDAGVRLDTPNVAETIIWAGAYVGEVIRRNAKRRFRWLPYEEYMAAQPRSLRNMIPYEFGTQFILAHDKGGMTLPINKVCRWLEEGPENDLHFYAAADIARE